MKDWIRGNGEIGMATQGTYNTGGELQNSTVDCTCCAKQLKYLLERVQAYSQQLVKCNVPSSHFCISLFSISAFPYFPFLHFSFPHPYFQTDPLSSTQKPGKGAGTVVTLHHLDTDVQTLKMYVHVVMHTCCSIWSKISSGFKKSLYQIAQKIKKTARHFYHY